MLHFILGRVSSGKTTYLHKKLGEIIDSNSKDVILIVPEQFTFETDKGILDTLGPVNSNKIDVLSFTRLADSVFEHYKIKYKETLSDQGRVLFMSLALESVQDKLEIYRKHINNPAFIQSMLLVVDELKQSSSDMSQVIDAVEKLETDFLKKKMKELILICETYQAIVRVNNSDSGDSIENLGKLLKTKNYFSGKTVAIDGFTSFNGQILKVIEQILIQADDVYISITADGLNYNRSQNDVFAFTRRTANKIKSLAEKNCVSISKPIIIDESLTGYNKYSCDGMRALEENFYKPNYQVFSGDTEFMNIYGASDPEDECGYVSRKIRQLMRQGYRCRDIAVIYRDKEKYETELKYAFRKYDIPVFDDARQPILNQPIMLYVSYILKICSDGINTENILLLLKTGLTGISQEDISFLENYVYMWSIDGSKWKQDWENSPYAFDEHKKDDEKELLEKLNGIRKQIVLPIEKLKSDAKDKNAKEISTLIYEFLISMGVDKNLQQLAFTLEDDGEYVLASEQQQMWDLLMEILNEIAVSMENVYPDLKKYQDFFRLSLSVKTLGRIPTGIDEVIVGSADKMRSRNIKITFVLGLNAGVFPQTKSGLGVITDRDRNALLKSGIELYDTNSIKSVEERFIVYNSLCFAKEKVFLSYSLMGDKNEKMLPSEVITMVKNIFPHCDETFKESVKTEDYIEGETGTFELYASKLKESGFYSLNLGAYFKENERYKDKVKTLEKILLGKAYEIESKDIATELFGKNMYLSASRIETYENCPFSYYCRYGIQANPRKKAVLDPSQSGTIVHSVLEKLVKKYSQNFMKQVSEEECKQDIQQLLYEYADTNMGGIDNKNKRFAYQFNRLAKSIYVIMKRIFKEFENSEFLPCDFELEIGKKSPIKPYNVKLNNGGNVEIFGYVDRVDKMECENGNYIRVVDYKTGTKEMHLSDVLNGLNMQMLIYLMAIWKNSGTYYGDNVIPAGVLYLPARFTSFKAERSNGKDEIEHQIIKNGKMNGLLLDDTRTVLAMDESGEGIFIPASIDSKTGKVKGNVISLTQMKALSSRIDKIISNMAENLQDGKIWAYPVYGKDHDKTCEFCDYHSVCRFENKASDYRYIKYAEHRECLEMLDGGEE